MTDSKGIQTLVVKTASRCNLNCSYCYVYNMGDYTFLNQPKFMSAQTVQHLISRVKSYVIRHDIKQFQFIFHGGEPLLASKEFYREFVSECDRELSPVVSITYSVQTNGVLLDDEWAILLKELNIYIGISFDGTRDVHNQYRVFHSGKGSFEEVVKGMNVAKRHQSLSLLSVINCDVDPIDVYDTIKKLGAISFDLLLPDTTYDTMQSPLNTDLSADSSPYGDWLIKLYDYWKTDISGDHITIQFFESIIKVLMGEVAGNALVGNNENNLLIIQTDGSYESPLKTGVDGFTKSSLSVYANEIDEACDTELVNIYYKGHFNLCSQCAGCPINNICGGGLISHRFSRKNGFNNPSVYCRDLMRIITHIQNDFIRAIPREVLEETNLEMLTYESARQMLKTAIYA